MVYDYRIAPPASSSPREYSRNHVNPSMPISWRDSSEPVNVPQEHVDRRSPICTPQNPSSFSFRGQLTTGWVLWSWAREIIWFNFLVVSLTPLISIYGLCTTPVKSWTVAFSVSYYVFNMIGELLFIIFCYGSNVQTVLVGITAGILAVPRPAKLLSHFSFDRIPSLMVSQGLQCFEGPTALPFDSRCWSNPRIYQVVGATSPGTSQVHRYRPRSVWCASWVVVVSYRVDARETARPSWPC